MTMTKKAGRLGSANLTTAISAAADHAKARIEQIDEGALEAISGGEFSIPTLEPTIPDIDIQTDGMAPSDDNPYGDIFGGDEPISF